MMKILKESLKLIFADQFLKYVKLIYLRARNCKMFNLVILRCVSRCFCYILQRLCLIYTSRNLILKWYCEIKFMTLTILPCVSDGDW